MPRKKKKVNKIPKHHMAYVMSWTESESGWGCRPDGYSLHVSQEAFQEYVKSHWELLKRLNGPGTPHEYDRPDADVVRLKPITKKAAKELEESKSGSLRIWQSDRSEYLISSD